MSLSSSPKLKIGVLAPNSNFVPFLAKDMLTAIESGLAEAHLDAEIILGSAGYNSDIKQVTPVIQQLILERRVDCVIAPLNISLIESLGSQCENQGVPLIALNLTEDPSFESARNSFVFVNSFYLWHSAWMSGYIAGQKFGSKGAAMSALHDGGYGLMFAFQLGLEAAQGTLVRASITHRNSSTEDPTSAILETLDQKPDFIWATYSGKEAVSFLKTYDSLEHEEKPPLVTLSPMVSENIRRDAGESFRDIWYMSGETVKSDEKNPLAGVLGREPNPYALLGYEAAHLIADAVSKSGSAEDSGKSLSEFLSQAEAESVRGTVGFNKSLSEEANFCLHHITDAGTTIEKILAPSLLYEQYQLACRKLIKQGWINPYLCA